MSDGEAKRVDNAPEQPRRSTSNMCEPLEDWEELDKRKLGLQYDRPGQFVTSQWPILPWPVFVFYRLVVATYTVSVFVLILARYDWYLAMFWWAYYMYWSHALLMTASIMACILTLLAHYNVYRDKKKWVNKETTTRPSSDAVTPTSSSDSETESRRQRIKANDESVPLREPTDERETFARRVDEYYALSLPHSFKAFWVLRNIGYNQVLITGLFFWTMLTDYIGNTRGILAAHQSIINALIVLVDCCISTVPIFFLHTWQPMLFALVYIIISIIFWFVGQNLRAKPFFFKVLDYGQHPVLSAFVIIFLLIVMIPTAQFFLVSICNLRKFVHRCMRESKYCTCAGCSKPQGGPIPLANAAAAAKK